MRKIKLVPDKPFHNSCDIAIVDVTDDGPEKKRGKITAEYAEADVRQLQRQGMDYEAAMAYFQDTIDAVIAHYIADEWECIQGCDQVMEIISDHVKRYY